jgi:PRTRC genetic system protein E
MFTELMPLRRKRRLLLTVSLVQGEVIRATVVPHKATDTEDNAVAIPLAITGTAEELDRELPGQLAEFASAHLQLQSTPATAKAEMEAAAKAAREEARKRTKASSSTSSVTTAKPTTEPQASEAPSLFSNQQPAETGAATGGECRMPE